MKSNCSVDLHLYYKDEDINLEMFCKRYEALYEWIYEAETVSQHGFQVEDGIQNNGCFVAHATDSFPLGSIWMISLDESNISIEIDN